MTLQIMRDLFPKINKVKETILSDGIFPNFARLQSDVTSFIRGNPIVSTAGVGIGASVLGAGVIGAVKKRRKTRKKAKTKRKKKVNGRKRKTKRRTVRIRKRRAKPKTTRRRKRRIIRGRGLGSKEIKHSGRGTRTKLVTFRTKQGKLVRFRRKI